MALQALDLITAIPGLANAVYRYAIYVIDVQSHASSCLDVRADRACGQGTVIQTLTLHTDTCDTEEPVGEQPNASAVKSELRTSCRIQTICSGNLTDTRRRASYGKRRIPKGGTTRLIIYRCTT